MKLAGVRLFAKEPYMVALLGAFIIMLFAFANGYALFFNDSRSYVRGPALAIEAVTGVDVAKDWRSRADAVTAQPSATAASPEANNAGRGGGYTANRSIYYGALALAGYLAGNFWLTIFVQSYLAALTIALLMMRGLKIEAPGYFLAVAVVSLLSTVGPISALMMPDAFAALMLISVATAFIYWRDLAKLDLAVLFAITAYAGLAHASHVVILVLVAAALLVWTMLTRGDSSKYKAISGMALSVVIGFSGQISFSKALEHATGQKPFMLPHITAHLVDMGPGYNYLKDNCTEVDFAVCKYLDRLPMYWEDFLGADPQNGVFAVADLQTKRQLSDEQISLAIQVFLYDPVDVTFGLTHDAVEQLLRFGLRDLQVTPQAALNYSATLPKGVAGGILNSRVGQSPTLLDVLTILTYASAVCSLIYAAYFYATSSKSDVTREEEQRFIQAGAVVLLGILANALICGVLASPYDRFQARVIWLLPLMAAAGFALRRTWSLRTRAPVASVA